MADTSTAEAPTRGLRQKLLQNREIEKTQGLAAAERALVDQLQEGPQSHLEFMALARLLMKQKKFDDAGRAVEKSKALAPLEADPLVMQGLLRLRSKQPEEAGKAFAEALRLDPKSSRAHLGAAAVKMAEENYDEALALCGQRVLDMDSSVERAHQLIARINMKKGDKGRALEELRTVIAKNPQNKRVLKAYIRLARAEGRGDEALKFLEDEANSNPEDARRISSLSLAAMRTGKPEVAVSQYARRVEGADPKTSDQVRYAVALIQAGELDKAEEVAAKLQNEPGLKPVAAKLRGDIAGKRGDSMAALQSYQATCRILGVQMVDADAEAAAATPAEKLALWQKHTNKSVLAALRERRAGK